MVGEYLFNSATGQDPEATAQQTAAINKKIGAIKGRWNDGWGKLIPGFKDPDANQIEEWEDNSIAGNVVWRALVKSQAYRRVGNLAGTDDSMVATLIMNMVGSEVVLTSRMQKIKNQDTCTEGTIVAMPGVCSPKAEPITAMAPTELMTFLRSPAGRSLNFCFDDDTVTKPFACQDVKSLEVSGTRFEGTDAYVQRMLFGGPIGAGNPASDQIGGIVGHILSGNPLDENIKQKLNGFRTPALRYLLIAQRHPGTVMEIARKLQPILSAELATSMGEALVSAARQTYAGDAAKIRKLHTFEQNLYAFSQAVAKEQGSTKEQLDQALTAFDLFKKLAANTPGMIQAPPGARLGLTR